MQSLQARLQQPKQTTLIDHFPNEFEPSQPKQRAPARRVSMPRKDSQDLTFVPDSRAATRLQRIKRDVNKDYGHEPAEQRDLVIQQKFDSYLKRRRQREGPRYRTQMEDRLAYHEGRGAMGAVFSDSEDEEPEPFARIVPLSHALKTTQSGFVTQYAVFVSEPHDGGCAHEHGECLRRRQVFDELASANAYAEVLLKGPSRAPPARGKKKAPNVPKKPPPKLQIESYQESYKDGLLTALLKLANGKSIYCEVRRERQAVGALDPDALRKKWAKEEFIQFYRKRFDVWLIRVVPIAYLEREQQDKDQEERNRQREETEKMSDRHETPPRETDREEGGDEEVMDEMEITTALEGDDLRTALANLPSPTQSEDVTTQDTDVRDGSSHDAASEAGSDVSMSSTSTLREEAPAGSHHHEARGRGPNPWVGEEYQTILCGSFTALRDANETAFRAAVLHWRPRTPNMDAVEHYEDQVRAALAREREVTDMDRERADIVFPVPAWHGHDDHRPWGFVHSRVMVQETVLEGPRDVGAELVREGERAGEAGAEEEEEGEGRAVQGGGQQQREDGEFELLAQDDDGGGGSVHGGGREGGGHQVGDARDEAAEAAVGADPVQGEEEHQLREQEEQQQQEEQQEEEGDAALVPEQSTQNGSVRGDGDTGREVEVEGESQSQQQAALWGGETDDEVSEED